MREKKNRCNILIATGLFPPDVGGPATYSKMLVDELPQWNIGVSVASFSGVRRHPIFYRHILYAREIYRKLKSADLVYAQDPVSVGVPAALAARALGKPLVLKVVGDYAWEQGVQRFGVTETLDTFVAGGKKPGLVRVLDAAERFTARRAVRIIVPSQYLKRVVSLWGVPTRKIAVIPNAVSVGGHIPDRRSLRKMAEGGKMLVSAGRLVPWKGFPALIEVMDEVRKKFPDAVLLIIGSGPLEAALEEKIRKLGLERNVRLTGAVPRRILHCYVKMADAFVLNTDYEGFSHQLLEAMALGTPVATTRAGGNLELIEHGRNGLFFDYNNKEEMKKAILRLLRDPALAKKLARAAESRTKKLTAEFVLEKTVGVLEAALDQANAQKA